MNEYDELFDNNRKTERTSHELGLNEFDNYVNKSEKNGLLLIIYIVVSLAFSFGLQLVYSNSFPDSNVLQDNIAETSPVSVEIEDNTGSNAEVYPYTYTITGTFQNNNSQELPLMYIDIIFYDEEDNEIAYYYYQEEDIASGDYFVINEAIDSNIDFADYDFVCTYDLSPTTYTIFNLLPVLFSAVLFFFVDWSCFKYDAHEFRKDKRVNIYRIISGFIMVYAALLVSNIILQLFGVYTTSQNEMTISSMFTESPLQLVLLFLLLCVFTPIVEEVVFRKIIFTFIEPKLGHITAIIGTGLIFGIMHVIAYGDFIQAIPYVLMGITFGYIYWRSNKNIFVTIGVHFLNNLLSYIVYFLLVVFGISI